MQNEVRQSIINKRKALGYTQKDVSDKTGISRGGYAAIERGLRDPSLETAQRICRILEMPVDEAFPIDREDEHEDIVTNN